jgi:hypothetical protein
VPNRCGHPQIPVRLKGNVDGIDPVGFGNNSRSISAFVDEALDLPRRLQIEARHVDAADPDSSDGQARRRLWRRGPVLLACHANCSVDNQAPLDVLAQDAGAVWPAARLDRYAPSAEPGKDIRWCSTFLLGIGINPSGRGYGEKGGCVHGE